MTNTEIEQMIESFGLEFEYHHFEEEDAIAPPFVVYFFPESDNFNADNIPYQEITSLRIELYTNRKDREKEEVIQDVLKQNQLPYTRAETFNVSEKMYMVVFETEVCVSE